MSAEPDAPPVSGAKRTPSVHPGPPGRIRPGRNPTRPTRGRVRALAERLANREERLTRIQARFKRVDADGWQGDARHRVRASAREQQRPLEPAHRLDRALPGGTRGLRRRARTRPGQGGRGARALPSGQEAAGRAAPGAGGAPRRRAGDAAVPRGDPGSAADPPPGTARDLRQAAQAAIAAKAGDDEDPTLPGREEGPGRDARGDGPARSARDDRWHRTTGWARTRRTAAAAEGMACTWR